MRSDDIVNVMYRVNFLRFSQSACSQRFFNSEKAMQGNKIRRQIAFAELRSATSSVGSRRKKLLDDHVKNSLKTNEHWRLDVLKQITLHRRSEFNNMENMTILFSLPVEYNSEFVH
ncbi:hypothetical protein AVEN_7005-1 [Araneus ventricosus]|uniref:Uncharacterized protein n=1 Tax=Araneus ventricosus TaxID=182803 RepID=A0A4Y2X029_ARAVE|nr:hypothetical protein AVEN_7005-1 [Araneus ventricosus]